MTAQRAPAPLDAPPGLADGGRRLWAEIASTYELRADERLILSRCCRMVDRIDLIDAELDGAPLVTEGSRGQQRAHPLLIELRGIEAELARLLRSLSLPDDPGDGIPRGQRRSHSARQLARARWESR